MILTKYKNFNFNRRFGVELEISSNIHKNIIRDHIIDFESKRTKNKIVLATLGETGWAQTNKNDYWHVKFDRTCGETSHYNTDDYGWEIASYIGDDLSDVYHIGDTAEYLKSVGVKTNKNCGLHIHVETKDFNTWMMGNLLARWLKIEFSLFSICDKCRLMSDYCKPLKSRVISKKIKYDSRDLSSFWYKMQPVDLGVHNNLEKRYSLNTIGFALGLDFCDYHRNTVELRMPECLLEKDHLVNWIKLILLFVQSASKSIDPIENIFDFTDLDELLYYFGFTENNSFIFIDKELFDLKIWLLKKYADCPDNNLSEQAKKKLDFILNF